MYISRLLFTLLFAVTQRCAAAKPCAVSASQPSNAVCEPFYTTFNFSSYRIANSISQTSPYPPSTSFVALSSIGAYQTTDRGLELYISKPDGEITTTNGTNDKIASGAAVNSTFTLLYGKVTFEVIAPAVPGIITAVILIGDQGDEIDVELLGGDPAHWQTNMFAPRPSDLLPLWGVFGSTEDVPEGKPTIADMHTYTIDWNEDRITWGIDGNTVRTLKKENAINNGEIRYPSHPTRIQMGIWDSSTDAGTSEWGKGPVDWDVAPPYMKAVVKSVTVECN
ncbi:putative glycosyl hydrolases family 16 [Lyophyllum shimeji]|uniref:Glycosyl hydrolases family 16 n=1 Tax=Lyophyllum shimeji TaxID=47721 RepID=A0A9P3UT38_LYOSH|nr:putative glycosyl hydrolases family 16 [Lyophyllum shimeji]